MAKKSNTTPIIIGLLAAGAIGYYLYYKNTADTVNGVKIMKNQSEAIAISQKNPNVFYLINFHADGNKIKGVRECDSLAKAKFFAEQKPNLNTWILNNGELTPA